MTYTQAEYDAMDDILEVDTSDVPLQKHVLDHIEKFGVKPKTIGIYWDRPDQEIKMVYEAIEDGIPYDEIKTLSKHDQDRYKKGLLLF